MDDIALNVDDLDVSVEAGRIYAVDSLIISTYLAEVMNQWYDFVCHNCTKVHSTEGN